MFTLFSTFFIHFGWKLLLDGLLCRQKVLFTFPEVLLIRKLLYLRSAFYRLWIGKGYESKPILRASHIRIFRWSKSNNLALRDDKRGANCKGIKDGFTKCKKATVENARFSYFSLLGQTSGYWLVPLFTSEKFWILFWGKFFQV